MDVKRLLSQGDLLCAAGDFAALARLVTEIQSNSTHLVRTELLLAREAVDRWLGVAAQRRTDLGQRLASGRARRGALRAYGAVSAQ